MIRRSPVLGRLARGLVACAVATGGLGPSPAPAKTLCVEDAHPGGEWASMGYDLGHSRHQRDERTIGRLEAARLQPAWTFSANEVTGGGPNEITGYPVIADGCLFVGSSTGHGTPGWAFALDADGGQLVWARQLSHGVYSTAAVQGDLVYFFVSRVGSPYVIALDKQTGAPAWQTTVDIQEGSDAVSSPVVFDGMVWVGVSGTAAEGDEATRPDFRGKSVLLDALTGSILATEWSIPDEAHADGHAGGAIWSTISIDPQTKYGYVGTGNPFNYEEEHPHTNAVLKIDLDRARPATFGRIVASYKGDVEEYFPQLAENVSCDEHDPVGVFLAGFECGRLDVDFGAAPNLFRTRTGKLLVGAGQKSGVYHVFDPASVDPGGQMQPVWKQVVGVPSLVGGIVGTPAFDGTALYTPHTLVGYLVALDRDTGAHRWVAPTADAVHWGNPVTSANGVIYTVDLKGFLDAYDAATGAPIVHRPLALGADTGVDPTFSWGGVSVARNTVYASVGVGLTSAGPNFPPMLDGFVIAFRPKRL